MLAILLALQALATTPDELAGAVAEYNRHAVLEIPPIEAERAKQLMDGEVVRILFQNEDPEEPSAAVAYVLSSVPRNALWIAAQDPHTSVDPGLTELNVRAIGKDHAIWYGYWDLPRPVRDRHWVVESRNNHTLAAATGGRGWEHSWVLVPDGLDEVRPRVEKGEVPGVTLERMDSAIFTPTNQGAWFMIELADGKTLLGYQATSVVGGAVPTWLVTKLVMSRMESLLRDLEKRAREWSPTHYGAGHAPVYGGDGEPVPTF